MYLNKTNHKLTIKYRPIVSIDILAIDSFNRCLLGKRINPPAKGFLFNPGGAIMKDESIASAFSRISSEEIGYELKVGDSNFVGVFEHIYKENVYNDADFTTHYISLCYKSYIHDIKISNNLKQHDYFKWIKIDEIFENPEVHQYCKAFFR